MTTPVAPPSANLKKALLWLAEISQEHPEKERSQILQEAEIRFDLTPAECEFLDKNFKEALAGTISFS